MMNNRRNTNVMVSLMLFAAAVVPAAPIITNGAYSDTESSIGNLMRASADFGTDLLRLQMSNEPLEVRATIVDESASSTATSTTPSTEGEVQGTSTPAVEVSDEPLEVTPPASTTDEEPKVEVNDTPLEVVEPVEEPKEEETVTTEEPKEETEKAPEPSGDSAPSPSEIN